MDRKLAKRIQQTDGVKKEGWAGSQFINTGQVLAKSSSGAEAHRLNHSIVGAKAPTS
jgi:hypothetical protein